MRFALAATFVAAAALALGIWTVWLAVQPVAPVGELGIGVWRAAPRSGTEADDPYSRARLARVGELPLGPGEGLTLTAVTDETGQPLSGACAYRVTGRTPAARLWTMAVQGSQGETLAATNAPRSIGSDRIVRAPDGTFTVTVAPTIAPGNWITSEGGARIRIVARLYDTTARTATAVAGLSMPRVERERC